MHDRFFRYPALPRGLNTGPAGRTTNLVRAIYEDLASLSIPEEQMERNRWQHLSVFFLNREFKTMLTGFVAAKSLGPSRKNGGPVKTK